MLSARFSFVARFGFGALLAAMLSLAGAIRAAESSAGAKAPATPVAGADGYFRVGFDVLAAFPFEPPEPDPKAAPGTPPPSAEKQIPAQVKKLDGKKVLVSGYMMPLKMEKALVTEFLLVASSQLCCYGATPRINEFIVVKMNPGAGVKPLADVPVEFYGTLSVREVFEEGYLSQIYTLAGEKMGKSSTD